MNFSNRIQATAEPIVHVMKELMYKELQRGKEIYDFGQAVVDFLPPKKAQDAIRNLSKDNEINKLSHVQGLPELRSSIARYRHSAFKQKISAENVSVTAGANHAFLQTIMATTDPGDEVLLLSPHFFNHEMTLKLLGCSPKFCKLKASNNFQPDLEEIERAWSEKIKALVIVNPGNPHGIVIENELLESLQAFVARKESLLIIDESYVYFNFREKSGNDFSADLKSTILTGSFSKSFSLAGWRIGYLIGEKSLINQSIKSQDTTIIHPSLASQKVALAALEEADSHLKDILPTLDRRRKLLKNSLNEIREFESVCGDGGVFVFAKLKSTENDNTVALRMLKEIGVVTSPGSAWGMSGYLRFSYGLTNLEKIKKAVEIMKKYFSQ